MNGTRSHQSQKVNFQSVPPTALPAAAAPSSFCSRQFRMPSHIQTAELTDLGHRTIEGMDAQGVQQRRTIQLQGARSGDATAATRELINVTETWCSNELGTIILGLSARRKKATRGQLRWSIFNAENPTKPCSRFRLVTGSSNAADLAWDLRRSKLSFQISPEPF
jgi:hypothetical protein